MGQIQIQTYGSFPTEETLISAEDGGHANAIQRAIKWLNDRLPAAIEKDHKLHNAGEYPPKAPFGRGGEPMQEAIGNTPGPKPSHD